MSDIGPELARRAIALIDLTDLSDDCTAADVDELCHRAAAAGTAAVCIWPDFVAQAAGLLADSAVRVATVVDFPSGTERAFATDVLTARALDDGADEIDVVIAYRALLADDTARAARVLDTVIGRCHRDGMARVKVILETGELPMDRIAPVARFAIDHGADFIKTSTGKTAVSATPEAVTIMLDEIAAAARRGIEVGIKPSGGIATAAQAAQYLELADAVMGPHWATPATFRFGASRLLPALVELVGPPSGAGA